MERTPYRVVGAGPAGITIAIRMACRGYKVTIFEVREKIGGILRYGIPEFRLPKSILDRYYTKMKELGILFRPNFALEDPSECMICLKTAYDAVFIGTGTWRPRSLNIPGETYGNVHYGINYLNNPDVYDLGENVVVIGAGNALWMSPERLSEKVPACDRVFDHRDSGCVSERSGVCED